MTLPHELLRNLTTANPAKAWEAIGTFALDIFRPEIDPNKATSEFSRRDREVASADFYLSTAGWDLWRDLDACSYSKPQKPRKCSVSVAAVIPSSACSRFCPPSAPFSRSGFVIASRWNSNSSPCDIR